MSAKNLAKKTRGTEDTKGRAADVQEGEPMLEKTFSRDPGRRLAPMGNATPPADLPIYIEDPIFRVGPPI